MLPNVTGDERVQRRGRVVIVAMIVIFLLVSAALGVIIWQRNQEEARVGPLLQTGVSRAGAPDWPDPIAAIESLPPDVGVVVRYAPEGQEPAADGPRALNLRVSFASDACQQLAKAEPAFAESGQCTVTDDHLSATAQGPQGGLVAEGETRGNTLLILLAQPADFTAEQLQESLAQTQMEPLRDLVKRVG